MNARLSIALLVGVGFLPFAASAADLPTRSPFGIAVTAGNGGGTNVLRVDFTVPANCVINVDRLHFRTIDGTDIHPVQIPEPELEVNQVTGKTNPVYPRDFTAVLNPADLPDHQLAVKFQGCTNGECYFPEQRLFTLKSDGTYAEANPDSTPTAGTTSAGTDWAAAFAGFTVKSQQTGYLSPTEFGSFWTKR